MKLLAIRIAKAVVYVLPMTILTAIIDLGISFFAALFIHGSANWEASYMTAVWAAFKWTAFLSGLVWAGILCVCVLEDAERLVRNLKELENKEMKRIADAKTQWERDEIEVKKLIEV